MLCLTFGHFSGLLATLEEQIKMPEMISICCNKSLKINFFSMTNVKFFIFIQIDYSLL